MELLNFRLRRIDEWIVSQARNWAGMAMRISVGSIYLLFGMLKFFPQLSPAEEIACRTIELMSFGVFSGGVALCSLALIETGIAVLLIFGIKVRWAIGAALLHMAGTFFPLFLLPGEIFTVAPVSLTLTGQYILKNVVLVSVLFALYAREGEFGSKSRKGH